jgi:pre-mRNA-splicing factor SYF1
MLISPPHPTQTTGAFWQTWKDFEVRHGNEDTIREMLRIRRSVQATYNTQVNFMASQMLKVSGSATGTGECPSLSPPHRAIHSLALEHPLVAPRPIVASPSSAEDSRIQVLCV